MITSDRNSRFNKKDLTEQLAARADIPKSTAAKTINMFTEIISEALTSGKKVTISDFGTFNLSERSAFEGYDPQNNRRIHVPPRIIPVFRAGKKLKQALNVLNIRSCTHQDSSTLVIAFNHLTKESFDACKLHSSYHIIQGETSVSPKSVEPLNLDGNNSQVVLSFENVLPSNFTLEVMIPHIDLSNKISNKAISFEVTNH
jgi:DNA-binding protein HU-beta